MTTTTNSTQVYRKKLQAVIKKMGDALRDVELITVGTYIDDQDRDATLHALEIQFKKIKAALKAEPAAIEIEWPKEEEEDKESGDVLHIEKSSDKSKLPESN